MILTLELTPETVEMLNAEVAHLGIPAGQIVESALKWQLPFVHQLQTPNEDWEKELDEDEKEMWAITAGIPVIPHEALRRENFYADDGL